jgi:hypothetical protein
MGMMDVAGGMVMGFVVIVAVCVGIYLVLSWHHRRKK